LWVEIEEHEEHESEPCWKLVDPQRKLEVEMEVEMAAEMA
jgi:hypothetical protein